MKRKILALAITLGVLGGCVATGTQEECWCPKSEYEMYILMGSASLDAMSQYEAYLEMLEEQGKKGPLKGLEGTPNEWY